MQAGGFHSQKWFVNWYNHVWYEKPKNYNIKFLCFKR